MNFLINLIAIIVSIAAIAVFGIIVLIVATLLYGLNDNLRKSLEEIEQPQPQPPATSEEMEIAMENVVHAIKIINDEDGAWRALRMINKYIAEYSDHPDINKDEENLRRMWRQKIALVFEVTV